MLPLPGSSAAGFGPASGRVLMKLGMQQEGLLRRHRRKFGRYEDLVVCGILRSEWQKLKREARSESATFPQS